MTLSINDDCDFDRKGRRATDGLLELLKEHHDFAVPFQFVTKQQVIEIRAEPEISLPVNICVLPIPVTHLTVDAIKRVVCRHFGISHNDMISPRRDKAVQRPRAVAMYLAREFTSHGLPALGRFFHRDHTSCLAAIRKMATTVSVGVDPITRDVSYLRDVLSA